MVKATRFMLTTFDALTCADVCLGDDFLRKHCSLVFEHVTYATWCLDHTKGDRPHTHLWLELGSKQFSPSALGKAMAQNVWDVQPHGARTAGHLYIAKKKGTPACSQGPFEFGECPANRLPRESADERMVRVVDLLKKGFTRRDIVVAYPVLARQVCFIGTLGDDICAGAVLPVLTPPKCLYVWGDPGVGKTYNVLAAARASGLSVHVVDWDADHFGDYVGQDILIFNEVDVFTSRREVRRFCGLLTDHPIAPVKWGRRAVTSRFIIFTSNVPPTGLSPWCSGRLDAPLGGFVSRVSSLPTIQLVDPTPHLPRSAERSTWETVRSKVAEFLVDDVCPPDKLAVHASLVD